MRTALNISAVLLCGALAGLAGLTQVAPSQAAVSHIPSPPVAGLDPTLVSRSSGGMEAHFAAANTTHDGQLTREQAVRGDWPRVAKHFDEIDADHRGWVTLDQIHAFNKAHRVHRKEAA